MAEETQAPAAPANGKKTIRTVVLTIVALVVLVVVIFLVFVFGGTNAPLKVVDESLEYLDAENFSQFYELTTDEFKTVTTTEDLETLLQDFPVILDAQKFEVEAREVNTEGQAYFYGNIVDSQGNKLPMEFLLYETSEGIWQIQGFNIDPQ